MIKGIRNEVKVTIYKEDKSLFTFEKNPDQLTIKLNHRKVEDKDG